MKKSWPFWILATLIALIALLIIYICAPLVWAWARDGGSDPAENHGATLPNIGLLLAGIIALPLALWRSFVAHSQAKSAQGQLAATQQSLRQERYQRGIEMLWNELLPARMGGIYALLRLAESHPEEYHLQVMEPLCAFVRNPYGIGKPMDRDVTGWEAVHMDSWESIQSSPFREDVRAIIYAISKRGTTAKDIEKEREYRPDLTYANFTFADLTHMDLSGTDLTGALFLGARCNHTNFSGAVLRYANFFSARCLDADLRDTTLEEAKLEHANMISSDFSDSKLHGTSCLDSDFSSAKLCRAEFIDAHLCRSKFEGADLSGTKFDTRINLDHHLLNRSYSGLTQEQLDKAVATLDNPPSFLFDAVDPATGKQLVWHDNPSPPRAETGC